MDLILVLCPPHWTRVFPLGPVFLKSYLQALGFSVKIIDLNIRFYHQSPQFHSQWLVKSTEFETRLFVDLRSRAEKMISPLVNQSRFIGFSCYDRNFIFTRSLIDGLPDKHRIIFGGPQMMIETVPGVKTVTGEGELPLAAMLSGNDSGMTELDDLDTLPFYDLSDLDLGHYSSPFIPLQSSRGCVKRCAFCEEKLLHRRFRQHSTDYMVEHIKYLITSTGRRQFVFHDSAINLNPSWLEQLCRKLVDHKLDITWEAQAVIRPEMDAAMFRLVKQSGCYNLFFGLESGSDTMLAAMNKGYTASVAASVFHEANQADFNFEISLIFDFPGENDTTYAETIDFLRSNQGTIPKLAQVNPFVASPLIPIKPTGDRYYRRFLTLLPTLHLRHTRAFIGNLLDRLAC